MRRKGRKGNEENTLIIIRNMTSLLKNYFHRSFFFPKNLCSCVCPSSLSKERNSKLVEIPFLYPIFVCTSDHNRIWFQLSLSPSLSLCISLVVILTFFHSDIFISRYFLGNFFTLLIIKLALGVFLSLWVREGENWRKPNFFLLLIRDNFRIHECTSHSSFLERLTAWGTTIDEPEELIHEHELLPASRFFQASNNISTSFREREKYLFFHLILVTKEGRRKNIQRCQPQYSITFSLR